METTILNTNAVPVYSFLSFLAQKQAQGKLDQHARILDCGAGGPVPPLALFRAYGFDTFGVDISDLQLERANAFCKKKGLEIDFRKADMRKLPFEDDYFDCVYEHYAMCHLNKQDTAVAIGEMNRVTRQGGFCFLGVISTDSWPKFLFGQEKQPGEYWENEDRHTMFTDQEADELVHGWKVLAKEKRVLYLPDAVKEITQEKWMSLYPGSNAETTIETWQNQYAQRGSFANYSHIYYILQKE